MEYLQCMQVRHLGRRLDRVLLVGDLYIRLVPLKYPTSVSMKFPLRDDETYQEAGFGRRTGKYQGDWFARPCAEIVPQINCTSS